MVGMGYVVYGAGAIGGVVGGRLAQAGIDVTLIARGQHLEVLRTRGLCVQSPAGEDTIRVPAVGHPAEVDWSTGPIVLLAVKSHQTGATLPELVRVAPPATHIACLQNGIANEASLLRFFPNVHGVCVMCPGSHLAPGVVQAWSAPTTGLLDIGRFPRGSDQISRTISDDFNAATFSSLVLDDIQRWKRRKLLTNLGNAVEALCGGGERSGTLMSMLEAEGVAVLSAAGLDTATRDEDRARRADLLQLGEIAGQARQGGSSWQSVSRGTGNIETDYLNGEIVLLGRIHGVPTPANDLIQQMARQFVSTGRAASSVRATAILDQLGGAHAPTGTRSG